MNLRLTAVQIFLPNTIKHRKLCTLFSLTANAFSYPMPVLDSLPYGKILDLYATFTRDAVEDAERRGKEFVSIRQRLFDGARAMGSDVRKELKISTFSEAMIAARVIYRSIGIDFRADPLGNAIIPKCFFSTTYSESVCRLISALDEGLIAGLSGNGRLSFSQRITEGFPCCTAKIEL